MSANGIIDVASRYPAAETADRLERIVRAKGLKVFARIDQAAEAASVGLTLRPTQLLLFGDPRAGTALMDQYPSLALDLPLRVLVWESAAGEGWLSYNSPEYLRTRHQLAAAPFSGLAALVQAAAGEPGSA